MLKQLRLSDPVTAVSDFSVAYFGLYTLLYWVAFLFGANAAVIDTVAIVAFIAACPSIFTLRHPVQNGAPQLKIDRAQWPLGKLICVAVAAGIGAATNLIDSVTVYWLFLVAAALVLIVGLKVELRYVDRPYPSVGATQVWAVAGLCVVAASIVLISHRPDADDEYYLAISLAFLENPEMSLSEIGILRSAYGLASYYNFVAGFARLTGLPLLDIYYLVFPAVAGALSVLANFRLFKEITDQPMAATIVVLAVYLLWADMHTAPGNFAFVRLFQGKAIFTIVVVPLLFAYAIRIFRDPGWRTPLLLTCAVAAGIALTQTALIILPIFLVLVSPLLFADAWRCVADSNRMVFSAETIPGCGRRLFADGLRLIPICIPFLLAVAIIVIVRQMPEATPGRDVGQAAVYIAVGADVRAYVGFAAIFILPAIVPRDLRVPLAAFLLLFGLIVFNPAMQDFMNYINRSSLWRVMWIFPVVPATAVGIVWVAKTVSFGQRWLFGGLLVVLLVGYASVGPNVFTRLPDPARIGFPQPKIPSQDRMRIRNSGNDEGFPIIDRRLCLSSTRCY